MSDYLKKRQEYILSGRPLKSKTQKRIAKVSEKRKKKLAETKERGTDGEMDNFFKSLRKRMTGRCLLCNGATQKNDDETFHFSLAHLLPKSIFKSVATLPDNVIELCFYGESCHANFDNGKISWELLRDSAEWSILKEKLLIILPQVAEEERKHKLYSKLTELIYLKH